MKCVNLSGALVLVAALASGCCGGNRDLPVSSEVAVLRDSISVSDSSGDVCILYDAPVDRSGELSLAVGEYFSEVMGGSYEGDCLDFASAAQYYFDRRLGEAREFFREYLEASEMGDRPGCYDRIEFAKVAETDKFVSFRYSEYSYSGGAHGTTLYSGVTFRKSDARRIGWDVVAPDVYSEELQMLIAAGLREYWGLSEKDNLKEYLFDSAAWSVPLPVCPPVFEPEGVRFIYNEYEIASYASGRPTFVVPYERIEPLMMVTARRLLR